MAPDEGLQMGCWLAGKLMKELGLVSCQQPIHWYKLGGQNLITWSAATQS